MNSTLEFLNKLKKVYRHLCQETIKKHHLTMMEFDIIMFLYNNPDLDGAKDIVNKKGFIKSQVSMTIETLVKKNLITVEQDENDKRKNHLKLLENTNEIIKDGKDILNQFNNIVFQNISKEEKDVFHMIMMKIHQNMEDFKC